MNGKPTERPANVSVTITPVAGTTDSHVYEDGQAYLNLSTMYTPGLNIQVWVGQKDSDLAAEEAGLRKLAKLATELADHLRERQQNHQVSQP